MRRLYYISLHGLRQYDYGDEVALTFYCYLALETRNCANILLFVFTKKKSRYDAVAPSTSVRIGKCHKLINISENIIHNIIEQSCGEGIQQHQKEKKNRNWNNHLLVLVYLHSEITIYVISALVVFSMFSFSYFQSTNEY